MALRGTYYRATGRHLQKFLQLHFTKWNDTMQMLRHVLCDGPMYFR